MYRTILLGLSILTGMTGCASPPSSPPQWLSGHSYAYPSSRFLTAIGEAPNRAAAEQQALASLARVFEVSIREENTDFSLFSHAIASEQTSNNDERTTTNRQITSRQLQTATAQIIEGAKPVEYWRDTALYTVLVALDREKAAQRVRQQILTHDQQITALSEFANNRSLNTVVRLSALEDARRLQQQRSPLNRNLSVLVGQSLPSPHTIADLEQRIRLQLAQLTFRIASQTDLSTPLEHAIGQLGARISTTGELGLNAFVDREPIKKQQGWYWLRGAVQLTLLNSHNDVIAQKRWPMKVSAQDNGMLEQRLRDQVNTQIASQLYHLITTVQRDK